MRRAAAGHRLSAVASAAAAVAMIAAGVTVAASCVHRFGVVA